jgi:hypothetical protein
MMLQHDVAAELQWEILGPIAGSTAKSSFFRDTLPDR